MKRIKELDFTRVIAMFAVVMIHVTSTYINQDSSFILFDMNLAFILNQVSRFSVPLFIVLSGISLGFSKPIGDPLLFYKKRLVKIGIPYLFWFTAYYVYNNHNNLAAMTLGSFVKEFLLGQSAPHLYFIIIIFQLYILFPFLKNAISKSSWSVLIISFVISYSIEKLFFFLQYDVDLIPAFIRPYLWILFPTWLFYFVFGLVLCQNLFSKFEAFCTQHFSAVFVATGLITIFYVLESRITNSLESIKAPLNIYTIFILVFLFSLWSLIGRYRIIQKAVDFFAKHSLTIYFEHVFVLYFLRTFSFFNRGMSGMILLFITVIVVASLVAYCVDSLVHKISKIKAPE